MQLELAEDIAKDLLEGSGQLGRHFEKYTICGSIRRKKQLVNDIDIVAIPKKNYAFGEMSLYDYIIHIDRDGSNAAKKIGRNGAGRYLNGPLIKRFQFKGIMIDLYIADENTYSCLILIRTGSKDHNVRLTTLARGMGMKLFAGGEGLCIVDQKEKIVKTVETNEDKILLKILKKIPNPQERN